jgi:pimeloyl-ACP methyl ester carboxylesterase
MRMALALAVLVLTACGSTAAERPTVSVDAATLAPSVSAQATATTSAAPPSQAETGFEPIAFSTNDGVAIEGRLFGEGDVGVVLAHGSFDSGQGSWVSYARALAAEGYLVLTLNLRGYCPGGDGGCSGGERNPPETWRDVVAAVDYLRERKTATVFVMGASLGARSCLWAASRPGVTVAGVIGVSTPEKAAGDYSPGYDFTPEIIAAIEEPKLFMAGDRDGGIAAEAQTMLGWATEPKYLTVLPTAAHGPDLLTLPGASKAVLDFLVRYR